MRPIRRPAQTLLVAEERRERGAEQTARGQNRFALIGMVAVATLVTE
jgi:putative copper export protein